MPGTLDANIPFVSGNHLCTFFWGLGTGASIGGGASLMGTITSPSVLALKNSDGFVPGAVITVFPTALIVNLNVTESPGTVP